jgi:hypothetical protein
MATWGIGGLAHAWGDWEEERLSRVKSADRQTPENETKSKPLFYGLKGEVLIERRPRPVGFRRP